MVQGSRTQAHLSLPIQLHFVSGKMFCLINSVFSMHSRNAERVSERNAAEAVALFYLLVKDNEFRSQRRGAIDIFRMWNEMINLVVSLCQ